MPGPRGVRSGWILGRGVGLRMRGREPGGCVRGSPTSAPARRAHPGVESSGLQAQTGGMQIASVYNPPNGRRRPGAGRASGGRLFCIPTSTSAQVDGAAVTGVLGGSWRLTPVTTFR